MALRYSSEALIQLRESPLCVRPNSLPPAEEWMGPPPETFRNSQGNKAATDRQRHNDASLLEQTNRRPGIERHVSRNSANPEEIVLGPPRTTFNSATLGRITRPFDSDKAPKDSDPRDRFAFRNRNGDTEGGDRFRDRDREGRNNFRRRGEGDQEIEGWSTVKPRKSFGHEGAERFHGRMGDRFDRFAERRPHDSEDRDGNADRPRRAFGEFAKDNKDAEDERPRRNGLTRQKTDQAWLRDNDEAPPTRGRFDRSKSWRDRNADDHHDSHHEKPKERTYGGRWDRDRDPRQEREPEWLDDPLEEPAEAHTQEDFKKFMDAMKNKNHSKPDPAPLPVVEGPTTLEKIEADSLVAKPVKAAPPVDLGPDKFFAAYSQKSAAESKTPDAIKENAIPAPKPKSGSRFQNFFSSQEESRRQQTEIPAPSPAPAPPANEVNPLLAALAGPSQPAQLAQPGHQQEASEKVAFEALLQKLQIQKKQSLQATTPPSAGIAVPPPRQEFGPQGSITSPNPFQLFGQERRDEATARGPLPHNPDIHAPRPQQNAHYTAMRPEQQMLHDLVGQRYPSQNSGRSDQPSRGSNSNAEFLKTLMQGNRTAEPPRNEQLVMRMPQPSRPAHIPPTPDREPDYARERAASQHQAGRPAGLPSFFDEIPLHSREPEARSQPTQILQRPGPPGLEQMHPTPWMQHAGGQQMPPPPGRPMIPPPGLAGNQRNGPMPNAFPPNFPMGGFPPPEGMSAHPRNNMAPPPGFFGGPPPPPPGFMPPPAMGGFQGPEALAFGFDGRGMPPPGGPFRRN
ncbi:hypothetical protein GGR56DRAFT_631662 [Xylariaceae sp. FL0804]|nr:hypothetical protein GGR56DRAFT_631662 [Xylariaceae sp. FL0804]